MGLASYGTPAYRMHIEKLVRFAEDGSFALDLSYFSFMHETASMYAPALVAFERSYALDTAFVLPLLYASFCHNNRHYYAAADSVLRILARERGRLNQADRYWLDYQRSELAGDRPAALAAIRRAAELAPFSKATYNFAVTAYESRQPFTAESALGRLSPDLGPMRWWFPYWEVLTSAFHAERVCS